ncbi:cytochrome C oxidase subunit IV family protein [Formosa maritima]|uniref:Cytochrome C oxidase subunit IV family protein n=1 Tax=Formosa maritima TaxID=2592046 RepID=A0A5D0G093_9FLAO|nr:cytochrome C oxidase subunit IV family protein [Formosa maritima]TYA52366.1 hypothetical protein FVF61_13575 [Formosa maritima]
MKQKSFLYVLLLIIGLTIISAFVSNSQLESATEIIMILAAFKLLLVAFYFMDLRHANVFWKVLLIGGLTIFINLILII